MTESKPLWTEAEAQARALELLAQFDREPDVLSPDEQALCIAIRKMERAADDYMTYGAQEKSDEFINKNATSPPADKR